MRGHLSSSPINWQRQNERTLQEMMRRRLPIFPRIVAGFRSRASFLHGLSFILSLMAGDGETPRQPSPPRPIARSPKPQKSPPDVQNASQDLVLPVSVPSDAKGGGSEPWIGGLIRYMHGYINRYVATRIRTRGSRPYLSQVKQCLGEVSREPHPSTIHPSIDQSLATMPTCVLCWAHTGQAGTLMSRLTQLRKEMPPPHFRPRLSMREAYACLYACVCLCLCLCVWVCG